MSSNDDLALKLEWYEIRDWLLGEQGKEQDVKRALELASTCRYPDAQWLTGICAGKDVKVWEEAKVVFLAAKDDDARALCFAALSKDHNHHMTDVPRLRRSAELGYAFAQALLSDHFHYFENDEQSFLFAQQAALQGERRGFCNLASRFDEGCGCEKNKEEARKNYRIAAEMNEAYAMGAQGRLFAESDPRRWHWLGRAARQGYDLLYFNSCARQVKRFDTDPSYCTVVFMIGRFSKGYVDEEKRKFYFLKWNTSIKDDDILKEKFACAKRAIDFFNAQCAAARKAVDAWCLMAVRINSKVNRDIRKKIGMMIWEAREQADYVVKESGSSDQGLKRNRIT